MRVRVAAASSYLQAVREGEPLPSLDAALKAVSHEHFRRVDRFIQLALVGSGLCAGRQDLRSDCGVYLGSGYGPIGSNIATQEQMLRDRVLPKPYNFVNTLGNSAGFQVAKNLGLTGPNVFICRRGAALEATLETALLDLTLGAVSQALVGVVEEVTLPLDQHRARRAMAAGALAAEGSHWLLLDRQAGAGKSLRMRHFGEWADVEEWLAGHYRSGDRAYWRSDARPPASSARAAPLFVPGRVDAGSHDNVHASWVAEFARGEASGSLFLISACAGDGYRLLHLSP